ncbi:hypothetical protein KHQ06_17370 [Nocardia tengchongensis]|uniref:DUF2269 domain-containing protein n=1 Tax=Nocardia tengchongensis TaxID=2055889 RepID=A0ABX8CWT9_9NOCA|nr:hypothetical protein [Nocardia tengchongensis]QVI24366.1 hypothetical protein KHQ06_17370 [Nocardia tengchongensis]
MAIAALITWLLTAAGGFVLLGTWIAKGGVREPRTSHLPPPVIFGHFLLAAIGLVLWIIYLVVDSDALAWVAFGLLVPVAALGFVMLLRWIPVYRAARTADAEPAPVSIPGQEPAERHFPVLIVGGHGVFAVITVVLVLLTALGVGTS